MEETDPLSELGEWRDVLAYPNYQISSAGAFMNKRTLKILKHFRYEATQEPSVTLYRAGVGDVLSVQELLKQHFPGAMLTEPIYKKHNMYAKNPNYITESVDLIVGDQFFCS